MDFFLTLEYIQVPKTIGYIFIIFLPNIPKPVRNHKDIMFLPIDFVSVI